MGDEFGSEGYHFVREVFDDGLEAFDETFVLEGVESAHVDLQNATEVRRRSLQSGPVVQQRSKCHDRIEAQHQVLTIGDVTVDECHQLPHGFVVQLPKGQVFGEEVEGKGCQEWVVAAQQRDEELHSEILELGLEELIPENYLADLSQHPKDGLLLEVSGSARLQH